MSMEVYGIAPARRRQRTYAQLQQSAPHAALLMGGATVASGTAWNPADKGTTVTLSNSDRTYNTSGNAGQSNLVRAVASHASTGKYYFEVLFSAVAGGSNVVSIGVARSTTNYFTNFQNSAFYWNYSNNSLAFDGTNNGLVGTSSTTFTTGDRIACAVDLAAGKIWWSKNNTWLNGGNPGAGTGALFSTLSGTLFPAMYGVTVTTGTANFGASDFAYTPPSGFSPW